jgi:hypothetical protein
LYVFFFNNNFIHFAYKEEVPLRARQCNVLGLLEKPSHC